MADDRCRLCGGTLTERFMLTVLGRHEVRYFECGGCGSLQTERPYWLDEAYTRGALADLDTGAVMRGLDKQATVVSVLKLLGLPRRSKVLDFGGGTGLLCRLLRDAGVDAWLLEPRGAHELSPSHAIEQLDEPFDLICSFEVVEHLAEPREVLDLMLAHGETVLIGTEPYCGQGKTWWYLTPTTGQHVFFYAPAAFDWLAWQHGLEHVDLGSHHLLTRRSLSDRQRRLLGYVLRPRILRYQRALLAFKADYGPAVRDAGFDQ
jgi:hypothetical protein